MTGEEQAAGAARAARRGKAASSSYQGHDRRGLIPVVRERAGRPFAIGGSFLLLAWSLVVIATSRYDIESSLGLATLFGGLTAAGTAVALVASALCVIHWRLSGDAPALWVGAAFAVLGVVTIGLADLVVAIDVGVLRPRVLYWARPASLAVALLLLARALRSKPIDTRLKARVVIVGAFVSVLAGTAVLQLVPALSSLVTVPGAPLPSNATSIWAAAFSALIWLVSATSFSLVGLRRGRELLSWLGLAQYGLVLAELARAAGVVNGAEEWLLSGAVLRVVGLVLGTHGVLREVQHVFANQSTRLLEKNVESAAVEARYRAQQAKDAERAHEARNALTAIEGATLTLERYRDDLDDSLQRQLAAAVSGEIARLQRLVSSEQHSEYSVDFRLADVVEAQVALARSRGETVFVDVDEADFAEGRPLDTGEVLQNLLINAARHAGDAPVVVTSRREGSDLVLRVEDRGPGVPRAQRTMIFQRGYRSSNGDGHGLGLFISAKLMRDQRGALSYEDRAGGGARFVMRLPAVDVGGGSARDALERDVTDDDPPDVVEVAD